MVLTPVDWDGLVAAFPDDVYLALRGEDPGTVRRAAVGGSTWSTRTRSQYWESDWVMMFSASADALVRERETAEHLRWHRSFPDGAEIGGVTFADETELPPGFVAGQSNAWSWFWTNQSRAAAAEQVDVSVIDHHDARLVSLLQHSDTASHERDGIAPNRWFGYEVDGDLVCAAAVNVNGDATYLQSVVTHTDHRGRGFGRRVCSHATWWSLQQVPYATLGMMTDNTVARRLYESLGYVCDKRFRSVRFAPLLTLGETGHDTATGESPVCGD